MMSSATQPTNYAFLIAAFRSCPKDQAPWVTGFPGDPASGQWGGAPIVRRLPGYIVPYNNNYVCVSTFRAGTDGRFHRRKANFGAMHVVMVDDIGTKVPENHIVLEPSVLVETSPDNYQGWYFLDKPEPDRGRAELLIDRMIEAGLTKDASDPGMRGVTRYGRLPIGQNGKHAYVQRLGAPFKQRVAIWQLDRRVSMEGLAAAYDLDLTPKAPAARRRVPASSTDDLVPEIERLGLYIEPLSGAPDAHRMICPWVHEHTKRDESGTVYFEPSEANAWRGGFKCHHGHCMNRNIDDLQQFLRAAARIDQIRKAR
jgi:hypothetical protein